MKTEAVPSGAGISNASGRLSIGEGNVNIGRPIRPSYLGATSHEPVTAGQLRVVLQRLAADSMKCRELLAETQALHHRILRRLVENDIAKKPPEPRNDKLGRRSVDALVACLLRESHKLPCSAHLRPLNASQLRVAAALLQLTGSGSEWPRVSHAALGQRVGLKARQIQNILVTLKDHGLIAIDPADGRENSYDLTALVLALIRLSEAA